MANWIVVGSPENFEIASARGFDMFGFKSTRRRESAEMKPGDKLIFYLTGVMKFGGIANDRRPRSSRTTAPVFKTEKKPGEDYPFRVKTTPDRILDKDQWLDVKDYADTPRDDAHAAASTGASPSRATCTRSATTTTTCSRTTSTPRARSAPRPPQAGLVPRLWNSRSR